MKIKSIWLIVFPGLAVILGVFILQRGSPLIDDVPNPLETTARASDSSNAELTTAPRRISSSFGPSVTNVVPNSSNNSQPQNILDAYSSQLHQPISFFGRVVDQNNAVVVGANVKFVWTHYFNPETTYETNIVTDRNGGFSLQDVVGATLDVQVSMPDYYPMGDASHKAFSYSKTPVQHPFQPDPGNPVVFHLRKKGMGAPLIRSARGMRAEFPVVLPRDGTIVKIDLLQRQIADTGQLLICQDKPEFKDWKNAERWGFKMVIPDGGFIEESDEFPFEAPGSGYQPTLEFRFQQGQPDWRTDVRRDYYFKFGNPPKFGHLQVVTAIYIDDVRLTYEINPDGTRNLEPK